MKINKFNAYLIAGVALIWIAAQLVGVVVEYKDRQEYYRYRTALHQRYGD